MRGIIILQLKYCRKHMKINNIKGYRSDVSHYANHQDDLDNYINILASFRLCGS